MAEAISWISVAEAISWISVAEAISWIYTVREIVSPNALPARGERISIPHSGVRLHSVALHLLSKQHPPLLSPLCTHAPHKYFRKFPKVEADFFFFVIYREGIFASRAQRSKAKIPPYISLL